MIMCVHGPDRVLLTSVEIVLELDLNKTPHLIQSSESPFGRTWKSFQLVKVCYQMQKLGLVCFSINASELGSGRDICDHIASFRKCYINPRVWQLCVLCTGQVRFCWVLHPFAKWNAWNYQVYKRTHWSGVRICIHCVGASPCWDTPAHSI